MRARCSRIPVVLVRAAVQLGQGFAHHGQFGLAVPFESLGVALPELLGHKMIGDSAGAQARGEGVTQLVKREVRCSGPPKRGSPSLLEAADVRLLTPRAESGKEVVRSRRLLHLQLERLAGKVGHRHVTNSARRLGVFDVHESVLQIDL